MGFLLPNAHSLNLLLLWSALIGAMYGACLTLFPAATYDFFGTKNGGVNYGLVFSAWGVGGALGNYAIGWIYDLSGKTSFNNAYYLAAGLLVVAAILAVTVKPPHHTDEARTPRRRVVSHRALAAPARMPTGKAPRKRGLSSSPARTLRPTCASRVYLV